MSFGVEVRRRRKAQQLTLEALAHKAGLTVSYLSTVETNQRDPSLSTIRTLAKALGIPVGDLVDPPKNLAAQAKKVTRLFEHAPPEIQQAVVLILGAVAHSREDKPRG
jgi:transcriptional regulator with XRE-family HTH domain